jgi:hypothetical protein
MQRLCVDYSKFVPAPRNWPSIEEFRPLEAGDGVQRIGMEGTPATLDIQFLNWSREVLDKQRVVPVFFSAAVGGRNARPAPFFSGAGLAAADGYAAIALSDPALALDPDISLGWYAGGAGMPTQERITSLLSRIATELDKELLLVGGSGGGFAAYCFGARLGDRASVLVWNPQTDILRYYRPAVSSYLHACFDRDFEGEGRSRELLDSHGICSRLESACGNGQAPRRVVYLQNVSDRFHVERHAVPFLSALRVRAAGKKGFLSSRDGSVAALFGAWSEGHEAPPKVMVRSIVRRMLNPDATSNALGRWLMASPFAKEVAGVPYPLAFGASTSLEVDACLEPELGDVQASAAVRADEGCSAAAFAFYLLEGEEKVATQWYGPGAQAGFPASGSGSGTVVAFARDDFGNVIQATSPVLTGKARSLGLPSDIRLFVLGSCVSRDPFSCFSLEDRIAGYVARTSLACAFDRRVPEVSSRQLATIKSSWQRRMVETDMGRRLAPTLDATRFDALLLDLVDERFAVGFVGGAPVTMSPEFSTMRGVNVEGMRMRPDNDARWALWCEGLDQLMDRVGPERVILNQAFWATHLDDGTKLADSARSVAMNKLLRRMYAHIVERFGVRSIIYPKQIIVGARQHKWGVSPFHYSLGFYKHTVAELEGLLA